MLRKISERWLGKIRREDLKKKMDRGDNFTLVDARSAESYREEHIKGAISLPVNEVDEKAKQVLSKTGEIIVYCTSFSCTASAHEVSELRKIGFKNVRNYAGGIRDWKEAGYPTGQT